MKDKDPSLMKDVDELVAVEIYFCEKGLRGETYLQSNVM